MTRILSTLLGLKFKMLRTQEENVIPHSLLLVTAFLIREDYLMFEDIDPYLAKPSKKEEKASDEEEEDEVVKYHQVLQKVLKFRYSQLDLKILDKDKVALLNKDIDEADEKNKKMLTNSLPKNLYLWLVTYLVQINDFDDAIRIIKLIWES
jgi:hypothetical protein